MPTYEYRCTGCDHRYETHEGFDAPARQPCPRCGEVAKRLLFPPPIVFKGSGFYSTDSRKGSSTTIGMDSEKKDGDQARNGDSAKSGGDGKGDSKPASTAANDSAPSSE